MFDHDNGWMDAKNCKVPNISSHVFLGNSGTCLKKSSLPWERSHIPSNRRHFSVDDFPNFPGRDIVSRSLEGNLKKSLRDFFLLLEYLVSCETLGAWWCNFSVDWTRILPTWAAEDSGWWHTVDGWNPKVAAVEVVYPIILHALYIPGGLGYFFHQQYHQILARKGSNFDSLSKLWGQQKWIHQKASIWSEFWRHHGHGQISKSQFWKSAKQALTICMLNLFIQDSPPNMNEVYNI